MVRLAGVLRITVPGEKWPMLVTAATFDAMRSRFETAAPDPSGVLKDRAAFFRRGKSGEGRELLTPAELARYDARVAQLAPPDLIAWLHHDAELRD